MSDEFDAYLESEWRHYDGDPLRSHILLEATHETARRLVLDVGCGGGQDLLAFARSGARCVGVDRHPGSGRFARELFTRLDPGSPTAFLTAQAEHLPLASGMFDVVICRVALPYTDNRAALREMSRVLRPGGVLLLKTHRPRYYTEKALDGFRRRSPRFSIHALRVLVSGGLFHVLGWQPPGGLLLREIFLTRRRLATELARVDLAIVDELPDSTAAAGSYRIVKRLSDARR